MPSSSIKASRKVLLTQWRWDNPLLLTKMKGCTFSRSGTALTQLFKKLKWFRSGLNFYWCTHALNYPSLWKIASNL
jgi:hypothetical protein